MNDNDVINYSNIFLYRKKDVDTVHEAKVKAHHLVYICSGELELFENGRKTVVREGECVFIRRDNRISMNKYLSLIHISEPCSSLSSRGSTRTSSPRSRG